MPEWKLRKKDDRYEVRDLKLQDFILSTTSLKRGKATTGHSHVYEEAYCFIKGCGTLVLGESSQEVKAGDIIIVPGRTFHRVFNNGCPELLFLCVFKRKTVAVAGGFDPIHIGHIRHMKAAKKLGDQLIAIVSSDEDMERKKGFCFMPLEQRVEIVESLRFVDQVVVSKDTDGTVAQTLLELKPDIFAKGGDRTPDNMPQNEIDVCREIGCQIAYGVGEQLSSSTNLVRRALNRL
jgi:cytidyltransferase-like protein